MREYTLSRRAFLAPALAAPLATLTGCGWIGDVDYRSADAPRAMPLARRPRVAWVLSSGGPRGFAHVGALKALDQMGLRPDMVVGASIGSLVGALYAAAMPVADIEQLAMSLSTMSIVRPRLGGDGSEKISGAGLVDWVDLLLGGRRLEQLPTPLAVAAVTKDTRELVGFTFGHAGVAIQASCAVEGMLAPVHILGRPYVDPDLVAPMPVRLALALGAQQVLAIDVSAYEDKAPPGSEQYRAGDLRKRKLTDVDARQATFTLHPEIRYYVGMDKEFRAHAIGAAYRQTLAQESRLQALFAAA